MSVNLIAIDGPAASGKSSAARMLADALGATYINTGSMYRAVAWKAGNNGLNPMNPDRNALQTLLRNTEMRFISTPSGKTELEVDGILPGEALRTPEISSAASVMAAIPEVRTRLVELQRKMASGGLLVMEGRDIGSVVFPDAKYKFFLTASPEVRARRRLLQDTGKCEESEVARIAEEIAERDRRDTTRATSPLICAPDAVYLDNSRMNLEETIHFMKEKIQK